MISWTPLKRMDSATKLTFLCSRLLFPTCQTVDSSLSLWISAVSLSTPGETELCPPVSSSSTLLTVYPISSFPSTLQCPFLFPPRLLFIPFLSSQFSPLSVLFIRRQSIFSSSHTGQRKWVWSGGVTLLTSSYLAPNTPSHVSTVVRDEPFLNFISKGFLKGSSPRGQWSLVIYPPI